VSNANDLNDMAMSILREEWLPDKPIRLLQLTAIHLDKQCAEQQLTLFVHQSESLEKREQVGLAMDEIREKFGAGAIGFGSALHNDIGVATISNDESDVEDKKS